MTEQLHFLSLSFFLTVWTFISKVMSLLFNMLSMISCVSFQIFLCIYKYINICMYVSFFLSFFLFYTRGRELSHLKKKQIQTLHCTLKFSPIQYLFVDLAHHIQQCFKYFTNGCIVFHVARPKHLGCFLLLKTCCLSICKLLEVELLKPRIYTFLFC